MPIKSYLGKTFGGSSRPPPPLWYPKGYDKSQHHKQVIITPRLLNQNSHNNGELMQS